MQVISRRFGYATDEKVLHTCCNGDGILEPKYVVPFIDWWLSLSVSGYVLHFKSESILLRSSIPFNEYFSDATPAQKRRIILSIFSGCQPDKVIKLLYRYGFLSTVMPFLHEMEFVSQKKKRGKTLFDHTLRALYFMSDMTDDSYLRMAAFFHDVGKIYGIKNHENVGADMVNNLLAEYGFGRAAAARVASLVRNHLLPFRYRRFYSKKRDLRRFIRKCGSKRRAFDICLLAIADKMASQGRNHVSVMVYIYMLLSIWEMLSNHDEGRYIKIACPFQSTD
jgi:hypothetical protein